MQTHLRQITAKFAPETQFEVKTDVKSIQHEQLVIAEIPALNRLREFFEKAGPRGVGFSALND